jgi:hypothetical protein
MRIEFIESHKHAGDCAGIFNYFAEVQELGTIEKFDARFPHLKTLFLLDVSIVQYFKPKQEVLSSYIQVDKTALR